MESLGRGRYGGVSWIIAASVVIFILGNCQGQTDSPPKLPFKPVSIKPKPGQSAPAAKSKTTTTTTTTVSPQVEEESEDAKPAEAEESSVEGETKPPLTGDPQIDYVWDPNLPRELNGFNLSHFPFFSRVPNKMSFNCTGLIDGFYANVEYQCQVYHQCLFGIRYDFLCANYTAFDQKIFNCHFANEVDCVNSPKFFDRNEALYKTTTTTTTTLAPEARKRWRDQFIRRPPTGSVTVQEGDASPSGPRKSNGRRRPIEYDYYYDDDDYYYYDDITGSESDPTTTTTTTTTTHAPATRRHGMRRRPGAGGRPRQRGGQFRAIDGPRRRPAFDYDDETVASNSESLPPPKQASTANLVTEPETEDPNRRVAEFRNTGLAAQIRPKLNPNRPTAAATDSHVVTHPPPPPTPSEVPSAQVRATTAAPSRFGSIRRPNHRPTTGVEPEVAPIAPEVLEHIQTQESQTVPLPAKPAKAQKVQISIGENLEVETPAPKRPPFRPQNRTPSSRTTSAPAVTGEPEPLPPVLEPATPRTRQPSRITSRLTTTPPPPHSVEDLDEFVLTEEPIPAPIVPQRPSQRPTSRNNARPGPQFARFDTSFETERTVAAAGPGFSRGPQVPFQKDFVENPQPAQQGQGFRRGPQAPPSSNFPIQERDSRDIRLPVESSQFETWEHHSDKVSAEASSADSTWFPLNIYDLFHTTVR